MVRLPRYGFSVDDGEGAGSDNYHDIGSDDGMYQVFSEVHIDNQEDSYQMCARFGPREWLR